MNRYAVLGFVGTVTLIGLTWLYGAPLVALLDWTSAVVVGAGTFAVIVVTHGPTHVFRGVVGGLTRLVAPNLLHPFSERDCRLSAQVARSGSSAAWLMAFIGVLMGLIRLMQVLSDPTALVPALGWVMLCGVYALLLNLLLFVPLSRYFDAMAIEAGFEAIG